MEGNTQRATYLAVFESLRFFYWFQSMQLQTVILLSLVPQVLCCPRLFLQLLFSDRADAQAIARICTGLAASDCDRYEILRAFLNSAPFGYFAGQATP